MLLNYLLPLVAISCQLFDLLLQEFLLFGARHLSHFELALLLLKLPYQISDLTLFLKPLFLEFAADFGNIQSQFVIFFHGLSHLLSRVFNDTAPFFSVSGCKLTNAGTPFHENFTGLHRSPSTNRLSFFYWVFRAVVSHYYWVHQVWHRRIDFIEFLKRLLLLPLGFWCDQHFLYCSQSLRHRLHLLDWDML